MLVVCWLFCCLCFGWFVGCCGCCPVTCCLCDWLNVVGLDVCVVGWLFDVVCHLFAAGISVFD